MAREPEIPKQKNSKQGPEAEGNSLDGKPEGQRSGGVSPARREAFAILLEVERSGAHSDELLRGERVSALSQVDRNLCTALVMGTLRWQIRLDALIQTLLRRPKGKLDTEVLITLRMGAFQLLFFDRIPVRAAISESVALAKMTGHWFGSRMVNAVLRKLAARPDPTTFSQDEEGESNLSEETAHPAWMLDRWVRIYGLEQARSIWLHGQRQPVISVRLSSPEVESNLILEGVRLEPGVILSSARNVISGEVTRTAAFKEDRVRVQEEGSQLVAELAGAGKRILDCCAAPGGKTMILAELNPEAQVVACEVSPARFEAMRERILSLPDRKLAERIELRKVDATEVCDGGFDLVLADVPCSGTGTLGRNPEIRHRLQEADLQRHHEKQCTILWAALLAGSRRVVYSTCSLEPEENGDVVAEVLRENSHWRQVSLLRRVREMLAEGRLTEAGAEFLRGSIGADGALRLMPGQFPTDCFYVAMLERIPD